MTSKGGTKESGQEDESGTNIHETIQMQSLRRINGINTAP